MMAGSAPRTACARWIWPILLALVLVCAGVGAATVHATPTEQADITPTVALALNPGQHTVTVGEYFTVTVMVRTDQAVDGAAASLHFDPARLQAASVVPGTALPQLLQNETDTILGTITFAAGMLGGDFPAADFALAHVTFVALATTDETPLTFSVDPPVGSDVTFAGNSILASVENGSVVIEPLSTGTATPTTPSLTPTTTPVENFTPTPTMTPDETLTPSPAPTMTPGEVFTPSPTPAMTPDETLTPSPTPTMTPDETLTPSPTPTLTPGEVFTPSPTPTMTPGEVFTPSPTPTMTPGGVFTPSPTPTATDIAPTATGTSLPTPTPPQPRITRLIPNQGIDTIANQVTLYGAGLQTESALWIGGVLLNNYALLDEAGTLASVVAPAGMAPGLYDVTVTNPGGARSTLPAAYTVIDAAQPDLAVTDSDIWFDPAAAHVGEQMLVGVNIHRSGGSQPIIDVEVAFYRGAVSPETLLGKAALPPLQPGIDVVEAAFVGWTPDASGPQTIFAVVDPDGAAVEGSETNNVAQWTLDVLPPPSTTDTSPPTVAQVTVNGGAQTTSSPDVIVEILAADNEAVTSIFVVERVYSNAARQWVALQQSGWIPYASSHAITLSQLGGAHYAQVWAADAAGNISANSQRALINYLRDLDNLLAGQVRIYRIALQAGQSLTVVVTPLSGDPDIYIWNEHGELSGYSNSFDLAEETVHFTAAETGIYQIEMHGYLESSYALALNVDITASAGQAIASSKPSPTSPAVAPSSAPAAQQALPPAPQTSTQLFLPITIR